MLTACGHAGAPKLDLRTAPDPVVEKKVIREVICPDDLYRDNPPAPAPAADAVIRHNDAGGVYLEGVFTHSAASDQVIADTKKACADAGAKPPTPAQ
jgi:hypothetical protein